MTHKLGPFEFGRKPYRHWRVAGPLGLKLMSTPISLVLYRAKDNRMLRLPGGRAMVRFRG